MAAIINSIVAVLGAWLVVSPFFLGARGAALVATMVAGAVVLALGVAAMKQKEFKPTLDWAIVALGVVLVVWGIVGWAMGLGSGLNEIITGVLAAGLAFVATRFTTTYSQASFYDRGGAPMVDVKSLRMKDDTILMKALLLQSMPSTVYVKSDEVWKVLTMIPFDLIKRMPKYLISGYKTCKAQEREAAAKAAQEAK